MHYIYYWGEQNHITFLGDSRIRQLYFEFVNLLSLQRIDDHKAHQNLYFEDKKISVKAVCILKNIHVCFSNDLPNFYLFKFLKQNIFLKVNRKKKSINFHSFQVLYLLRKKNFLAKLKIYTCTGIYIKFRSCVRAVFKTPTNFVCFQEFLWHPMVNSSMYDVYKNWLMADKSSRPNLLITGSGTVSSVIDK